MVLQIYLPDPPSLYPSLIAVGAGESIAKEMDRAYNTRALELRSYYENSITNAFAKLANFPSLRESEKQVLDKFANLYLTKVASWREEGLTAYKRSRPLAKRMASSNDVSGNASSRRAFNTDYIPLLEHFFGENPFPTHADKVFLAKKSGMTYRQIHVWFQNRRTRTKKPNGTWERRLTGECTTLRPDRLRGRTERCVASDEQTHNSFPEASRSLYSSDRLQKDSLNTVPRRVISPAEGLNVLDRCTAPFHAFPSPYPPNGAHKPFPLESRGQLFSFQWSRHPNPNSSPQSPKTHIDDLVNRFALLSVRDTCSKRSQKKYSNVQDAATYFITTVPPPAPHPALVKPKEIPPSLTRLSPSPIVRISQPTSQVFMGSTASLIPTPSSFLENDISSRRKIFPLPKRHPRQFSPPYRNVTPPTPNVSSSPSAPSLRSFSDSRESGRAMPCTFP